MLNKKSQLVDKNNDYSFSPDYLRQLQTKISQEHAKAQLALKAGNRSEAQLCLTKKKLMENEVRRFTLPSLSGAVKCEAWVMKRQMRSVKNETCTEKNSSYLNNKVFLSRNLVSADSCPAEI